ncbi:MAG: hypothetical protein WC641_05290 [Patescibacteria group bacterium]
MNFLHNFDLKKAFKIAGLGLLAVVVLVIILTFLNSSVGPLRQTAGGSNVSSQGVSTFNYKVSDAAYPEAGMAELSVRNVAPMPPSGDSGTTGNTAEDFEVTSYRGTIETRELKTTCAKIVELKALDYVIFENANEAEHSCDYTFKVERKNADEILAKVKELNPKELVVDTKSIKRTVDDFTSEIEILQKKKLTVENTLDNAIKAYDDITAVATSAKDAASLSKIIDSKIQTLERLTQERINISTQLDRLARSKAEQLDKLEYTYFYLSVYENKYLDGKQIKDSWKAAVKEFVTDVNKIAQDVSINLVTVLLYILQIVLYFFILLIIGKYVWRWAKAIWKK